MSANTWLTTYSIILFNPPTLPECGYNYSLCKDEEIEAQAGSPS